ARHPRPGRAEANRVNRFHFHEKRAAISPAVVLIDGLSPPLLSRRLYALSMHQPPRPLSSLVQAPAVKEVSVDSHPLAIPPLPTVADFLRVAPRHYDRLSLPPRVRRRCANGKASPEPDDG